MLFVPFPPAISDGSTHVVKSRIQAGRMTLCLAVRLLAYLIMC